MTDITVDLEGYCINLRVGAIVNRGDDVLLCRLPNQSWWFLPGGRIKTNESSLEALQRELAEEIGPGFKVIRPVISAENFFEFEGRDFHEICTFYEVKWITDEIQNQSERCNELFKWIPRDQLDRIELKPEFIREHIIHPRAGFELVIHRENG